MRESKLKYLTDHCDELQSALAESHQHRDELRGQLNTANGKVWRLEGELKAALARADRAEQMATEATKLYGELLGYQQRVREEDAAKLGKMWHEAGGNSGIPRY